MTAAHKMSDHQIMLERAHTLFRQNKFAEAIPLYNTLLKSDMSDSAVWACLGIALQQKGSHHSALVCLKRAIELRPQDVALLRHYAYCLIYLNRKEECLAVFDRAFHLAPHDVDTWGFYAFALREFDMNEEALAQYDLPHPLGPEHLWCRADINLRLGRFKQGWKDFEVRWELGKNYPFWPIAEQEKSYKSLRWTGQDLHNKTILIYEEQGFGDSILCSRYIPLLKQRGARVVFQCRKELHRLFSTVVGLDKLVEGKDSGEAYDYHVPVMSLPALFGTEVGSIPPVPSLYVTAAPPADAACLLDHAKDRFKVGIVWKGQPAFAGNYKRSVSFSRFLPLAEIPGVQLYSLQKGAAEQELARNGAQGIVPELGPYLTNFADTAAVLKELDLVIMTDSAVAHVAGSIGCPVWNLLSNCAFWVYLMNRQDCPWYPSMRLFRQPQPGDWDSVFQEVAEALVEAIALKESGQWLWPR